MRTKVTGVWDSSTCYKVVQELFSHTVLGLLVLLILFHLPPPEIAYLTLLRVAARNYCPMLYEACI